MNDLALVRVLERVEHLREHARLVLEAQRAADDRVGEVAVLEVYLPQQMAREEIEKIVREVIAQTGSQGAKDMGKVMKALVPLLAGRADNKLVSELVKSSLG